MTTYPHTGMNSWGCLFFNYYDFRVLSFFFKLILTQRPGYLFADLIGARSVRTSNFIFPSVSPGSSVLVRAIRLWNQLPLAIKNIRSVAAFERAVMERMRTNLTLFRFFNYCYLIVPSVDLLQFYFVEGKNKMTPPELSVI
jgi:hypothetical protein